MGFRDAVDTVVRPGIRLWERVPIKVQARITIALPLVAVLVSAVLGISGNSERVRIETDLQRRFEMSAALGDLTALMINAETGMRGYLLTGQPEFLQPYDQASRDLPGSFDRLTALARDESNEARDQELGRLEDLRTLTGLQMGDLAFQRTLVSSGTDVADPELRGHLQYGKALMDRIRGDVGDMQATEGALLNARIADINAIRIRDYVSVALALAAALATRFLAWFLFRRGILRRVERLTLGLRDRRQGRPASWPPAGKRDQMGELEREIHLLDVEPDPLVPKVPK